MEAITEIDYVTFFLPFFGLTNNPALAPFANVPCPCQRYFMGGEGAWDHINSCLHHASNWTCAHEHVLRALERICNDAGFATTHKRVLTSEGTTPRKRPQLVKSRGARHCVSSRNFLNIKISPKTMLACSGS